MAHQHLIQRFIFIICCELRYFEKIVKLWIFRLRTIYNFFQVCIYTVLATLTWYVWCCDRGPDTTKIHQQAKLRSFLWVRGEGVEDSRHDHAELVAGDDGQDHGKVLPCNLRGRSTPVPDQKREKGEKPNQMCPDIHCFIVKREDRPQALAKLLWWSVPTK